MQRITVLSRCVPVAGPSRINFTVRPIHLSSIRNASSSTSPPPRQPPKAPKLPLTPSSHSKRSTTQPGIFKAASPSALPLVPSSAQTSTPTPANKTHLYDTSSWPWRPIPARRPEVEESERVIYARPLGFRPRMLYFVPVIWIIALSGIIFMMSLPPPKPAKQKSTELEEEGLVLEMDEQVEEGEKILVKLAEGFLPFFLALTTVMAFCVPLFPSRLVTRLTLVRSRPASGHDGITRTSLRLTHGGHEMAWGRRARPRVLNVDDIRINLLGTGEVRSPYLNLFVLIPHGPLSFDASPYKMNFKDDSLAKFTDQELVLSLSRIEQVFGKVEPRYRQIKAVESVSKE